MTSFSTAMTSPREKQGVHHDSLSPLLESQRTTHVAAMMAASRTTVSTKTLDRSGFRLQRHLEVAYTAPYHFNHSHVRRVRIRTGIILEFVLHQHPLVWEPSSHDSSDAVGENEVRVVLVMGFLNTKETWTPTIETMLRQWGETESTKRLKILSFDNRGVGGSTSPIGPYTTSNMAEDTLALLDHIGWEQAHVVGYSMGGMISLELANLAPERVKSLSLLCTTRGRYVPVCNGLLPMTRTLDHSDPDVETHNLLVVLYPPKFLSQEMESDSRSIYEALFGVHKYLVENRESPRLFGFVGQGSAVLSHFVSDERLHFIRDHQFPILVLGGAKDVVIPARETYTLQDLLASDHTTMVMYDDAGHGAFIQHLDEVAQDIITMVQSAEIAATQS